MKIIEILEDPVWQNPAGAPPTTPTKKFQSLDILQRDPEAMVTTWAPRIAQLQTRSNSMMAKLIAAAGAAWAKKLAGTTISVRSTEQYIAASAADRTIDIDITVFWDAPDATLAVVIGHELGHIALGHFGPAPAPVDQQVIMGLINNNTSHPSIEQRIDRAKKAGFKLSQGGQQQIDALQQHLA